MTLDDIGPAKAEPQTVVIPGPDGPRTPSPKHTKATPAAPNREEAANRTGDHRTIRLHPADLVLWALSKLSLQGQGGRKAAARARASGPSAHASGGAGRARPADVSGS
jgi:hypothetical protein